VYSATWDDSRQAGVVYREPIKFCWEVVSRRCLFELNHSNTVRAAAVTPDGRQIIVGEAFGDVVVWDLAEITVPQAAVPQPNRKWLSVAVGNFFSRPPSSTPAEEEPPAHHGNKLAT